MPLKNITNTFKTISSVSVSAPITVISSVTSIAYMDNIAFQYNWTGLPTGTFSIEGSLDYSPGAPQNMSGQSNPGKWNAITLDPVPSTSSGFSYLVNAVGLCFPYVRTTYTHTSGSGVINAFVFSKSVGS